MSSKMRRVLRLRDRLIRHRRLSGWDLLSTEPLDMDSHTVADQDSLLSMAIL